MSGKSQHGRPHFKKNKPNNQEHNNLNQDYLNNNNPNPSHQPFDKKKKSKGSHGQKHSNFQNNPANPNNNNYIYNNNNYEQATPQLFGKNFANQYPPEKQHAKSFSEKKSRSAYQNSSAPFKVAKLLAKKQSEQIEFRDCSDLASETENFLVIGVLGEDGTGKSTLLNQFAEFFFQEKIRPFQTHTTAPVKALTSGAVVSTLGSDFSGLILIDSQPCCSSSVLSSMILKDAYYPQEYSSHEHWNFIQSTQIALWMMSVCHFTFVVQNEGDISLNFLKWIRQVAKMKKEINQNPFGGENHYLSQTFFYLNEEVYDLQSEIDLATVVTWNTTLSRLFLDTFGTYHAISPYLERESNIAESLQGLSPAPLLEAETSLQERKEEKEMKPYVSFWIDHNDSDRRHHFFEKILSLPRPKLSSKITMKEWFYKSKVAWELVKSSQITSSFKTNY